MGQGDMVRELGRTGPSHLHQPAAQGPHQALVVLKVDAHVTVLQHHVGDVLEVTEVGPGWLPRTLCQLLLNLRGLGFLPRSVALGIPSAVTSRRRRFLKTTPGSRGWRWGEAGNREGQG